MRVYLILGCNGYGERGGPAGFFTHCRSVKNPILDISKVAAEEKDGLTDFLDRACGLFDEIVYDRNKITNIISFLYKEPGVISEDNLHLIQLFINTHKRCGVYLMLVPKEDYKCQT